MPPIFRMSSLLGDISDTPESTTSLSDPPVHSALTLNDSSPDTLPNISPQDRMALFWEHLDAEQASVLSDQQPIEDVYTPRPRRLRKSRSSIYPEQRFSTLSTTSLQNKLRKKTRSAKPVPLQLKNLSSPALDLPEGVKQIGSGIGFTYSMPAAALSKASICTTTPKTCHGYFQGRLPGLGLGLGLGLRSANAAAKAKARRTLLDLVITPAKEDICDFRGSSWSLSTPLTPDLLHDGPATASSSPLTEVGPLTPAALVYEELGAAMMGELGFEESSAHEVKVGDVDVTLRLVSSRDE
ncbi:hypothetical protein DXG03_001775 [Asterophora parasitica]|uniref:Uncharacterized protein n=1 Tax=Asterophora parasitica TaxID=117018 RepID=A0A9P7G3P1_9AGAR|nr:hypothetical protein DXG03_001775 [Asterophora parasitica]